MRPYLDYFDLLRRMPEVPDREVERFLTRYRDTPMAPRLARAWLDALAEAGRWDVYVEQYRPIGDVEAQCRYLHALYRRGRREEALERVPALWTVARSQPNACDPLFEVWIEAGGATRDRAWQRLTLALAADHARLARYLVGLLEGSRYEARAQTFYRMHREAHLVERTDAYDLEDPLLRTVIVHGLARLAANDPVAAAEAWRDYRARAEFAPEQIEEVEATIIVALARAGESLRGYDVDALRPDARAAALSAMARTAIARGDWQRLAAVIERLPDDSREDPKWRYWLARALRQTNAPGEAQASRQLLVELASLRHYYGFLAADLLGTTPTLDNHDSTPDPVRLAGLVARDGMRRLAELYAVDDRLNARREWYYLAPELAAEDKAAAAHVLAGIGWVSQAIRVANAAGLHDDLALRFPAPYRQTFERAHAETGVPLAFLYAVARGESAFMPEAVSSAGAIGLMQLMPGTARLIARRIGAPAPDAASLFDRKTNVTLASHHLAALLSRYDGRPALAAAAYNAGRGNVDQWLGERPMSSVDVWVETIPFEETRDYVKGVLAFNVVYSSSLGEPPPAFGPREG